MEQAGGHAVEEIEHGTEHDEQQREGIVARERCVAGHEGGNAAREQVAAGDGVGDMFFHCSLQ